MNLSIVTTKALLRVAQGPRFGRALSLTVLVSAFLWIAGCKTASDDVPADQAASSESPLVSVGADGRLVCQPFTDQGDVIIDFSYCGYKASEEPIPFISVAETIKPLSGEALAEGTMAYPKGPCSHDRIQAAIDRVGARKPDAKGFRGAVFLSKGTYYIEGGLTLRPGVILRGEGERGFGTILIVRNPGKPAIVMGSDEAKEMSEHHSMMAVEGMCITGNYDAAALSEPDSDGVSHSSDETHLLGWGVSIRNSVNVWIRGVRFVHTRWSAVSVTGSSYVTVRDCRSMEPVSEMKEGRRQAFTQNDSSMILFYNNLAEGGHIESSDSQLETESLFEKQLADRIGEKQAYLVLARTLSKASIPMEVAIPRKVVKGVAEGAVTPAQKAFEAADAHEWITVMEDDGTEDWTQQWSLDGEGVTTVTHTPEGMELHARDDHMALWTKKSFEGDVKIEYEFTRLDVDGSGVCIIYIQATGDGQENYHKDITQWADDRESPGMGKYFRNMHLYHISYACGYVRGRRYMPIEGKMNTYSELFPEYLVDAESFFEPEVTYKMTLIKNDMAIRMKAEGAGKVLYFKLNNEKCPEITEGPIGFRQMQTRRSRYKNFRVSVPK